MRAVWYDKLGEAKDVLQFGDIPVPHPGEGEVRVKIKFSGVNPSDVKRRRGTSVVARFQGRVIPHNDGSGVIDAVGPGVSSSRIGERVWIYEAQIGRAFGTAAEYTVIPNNHAVPLHDASFEIGASLGVPAMTAHNCIFCDGHVKGQSILVAGGSGSVGNFAIQFAKWGGAEVYATVSSEEKAKTASRAGADYTINYRTESIADRVKRITSGRGVDRIVEVEFGKNLLADLEIIKDDGTIVAYASDGNREPALPFYSLIAKNLRLRFLLVYTMSSKAHKTAVEDIDTLLRSKSLMANIGRVFPLSETIRAHEAVETGVAGKVIVEVG